MQEQEKKGRVVKVFFPEPLHHAMRVLLVSRRQTWEQWATAMAVQTLDEARARQEKAAQGARGAR